MPPPITRTCPGCDPADHRRAHSPACRQAAKRARDLAEVERLHRIVEVQAAEITRLRAAISAPAPSA